MRPTSRFFATAAVGAALAAGVVAGVVAGPRVALSPARLVSETSSAPEQGDTIGVHFAGRLSNQSTDPARFIFTGVMRSLDTGKVVGTMTNDLTCVGAVALPCPVLEATNTFRFADGTIVGHGRNSSAGDLQHPGFALIGNHPPGNNLSSGTGAFAGRTGRAHMSGRHDGRELPAFATFDDFWLIELDPR